MSNTETGNGSGDNLEISMSFKLLIRFPGGNLCNQFRNDENGTVFSWFFGYGYKFLSQLKSRIIAQFNQNVLMIL